MLVENPKKLYKMNNTDYYLNVCINYSNNCLYYHSLFWCVIFKEYCKKKINFLIIIHKKHMSQNYFINNFVTITPILWEKYLFLLMKINRGYILKMS